MVSIEDNIVIGTFTGGVTEDTFIKYLENLNDTINTNSNLKGIISNYLDANFEVNTEQLSRLQKSMMSFLFTHKVAVVMDSPKIAVPIYIKEKNSLSNLKMFSSLEAAKLWINS